MKVSIVKELCKDSDPIPYAVPGDVKTTCDRVVLRVHDIKTDRRVINRRKKIFSVAGNVIDWYKAKLLREIKFNRG